MFYELLMIFTWSVLLAILMILVGGIIYFLVDALAFRIKHAVKIHKAKRAARKFFKIYNKMMDRSGLPRITDEQKKIVINNFIAIHTGEISECKDVNDYFNIR